MSVVQFTDPGVTCDVNNWSGRYSTYKIEHHIKPITSHSTQYNGKHVLLLRLFDQQREDMVCVYIAAMCANCYIIRCAKEGLYPILQSEIHRWY